MASQIKYLLYLSSLILVFLIQELNAQEKPIIEKQKYGEAVSILSFDSVSLTETIITDDKLRESIFLHPEVKDRKIVVVSIIGAFRKGKSFLMDYCLRYMYAHYKSIHFMNNTLSAPESWMGDQNEPLTGFSWKGGSVRNTAGIMIWNDVFIHESPSGEKLAIVLVDTQGLFDTKTPAADNARIFALGTLLSSVQIFNLVSVIQEDQLQYLQLATDFARFAQHDIGDSKPFQKLIFLMRDWAFYEEFDYGFDGGAKFLKRELNTDPTQKEELKSVRQFIHSSFEKLQCFLMPFPGESILRSSYNGRWKEMTPVFKYQLTTFIENMLDPKNLEGKKIGNREITSSELNDYMKSYFVTFNTNEMLEVKTIYEVTAEKQMEYLNKEYTEEFLKSIQKHYVNYFDPNFNQTMKATGEHYKNYTSLLYQTRKKMGTPEQKSMFLDKLKLNIDEKIKEWELITIKNYTISQEELMVAKEIQQGTKEHCAAVKEAKDEHYKESKQAKEVIEKLKIVIEKMHEKCKTV
ncbi:unnamed protein product [Diamesa tonsa]